MTEPAWQGAGEAEGLQVWRIEVRDAPEHTAAACCCVFEVCLNQNDTRSIH